MEFTEDEIQQTHDRQTLDTLRSFGVELAEISLPDYPIEELSFILSAEAATAFDELTRIL